MAKQKNFTTPQGVARYPWLLKPDTAEGKSFTMEPTFHVDLILEGDDAEELKATINKMVDESVEAGEEKIAEDKKYAKYDANAVYPYEAETDDEGAETGRTIFKFKMKQHGKTREGTEFVRSPALFDRYGKKFGEPIFGGSTIRVSYGTYLYQMVDKKHATFDCGVTLRLRAVQVIEAAEGGANAENYGFDSEDEPEAPEAPVTDVDEQDDPDF